MKLLQPRYLWHINHVHSVRRYATHPGFDLPAGHHLEGSYTPSTTANPRAQNIAVLGGGISGLATAFNLSKDLPQAKITIFEANDQPGGWVDSERVEVNDGKVIFEWGPRSLRPDIMGNGLATLRLVRVMFFYTLICCGLPNAAIDTSVERRRVEFVVGVTDRN